LSELPPFVNWSFGFVSTFVIRISDFEYPRLPPTRFNHGPRPTAFLITATSIGLF
jgi:hypothetical protein